MVSWGRSSMALETRPSSSWVVLVGLTIYPHGRRYPRTVCLLPGAAPLEGGAPVRAAVARPQQPVMKVSSCMTKNGSGCRSIHKLANGEIPSQHLMRAPAPQTLAPDERPAQNLDEGAGVGSSD